MAFGFEKLCPFQSFILARVAGSERTADLVESILADVRDALKLETADRTIISLGDAHKEGSLEIAGMHYRVVKQAPWTTDTTIEDSTNHLVLVCRRNREIAILLTETTFRRSILSRLDHPRFVGLGRIEPVAPSILNAAFVNGPAKTLWLSGIHGRTTVKPDAKTLSGLNLRDALDPLADQTYFMTAARSKTSHAGLDSAVGVSPRDSRIWLSSSSDWKAFRNNIVEVLALVSSVTRGKEDPLPFVAVASQTLDRLGSPYEMAVIPPQLLADDPTVDPADLRELEQWSDNTSFEIEESAENQTRVLVHYGRVELGRVVFRLAARKHGRVGVETEHVDDNEQLGTLMNHCRRDHWLRIWFDSGDTFNGDGVFRVRFRDYPFENFLWDDFAGFQVTREKPADPIDADEIGHHDSLFCWTLRNWPINGGAAGWLICDDGAMELADFIHLDGDTLTMIHAKGSNSDRPDRQISVASYEVVVSQAVKCLRWLDQTHLQNGLVQGMRRKIGRAVWHNRRRSNRDAFLTALEGLGSNYKRRVIILQPQVTSTNLERAANSGDHRERMRHRQLMTLLNTARATCQGLGAELQVVGQRVTARQVLRVR